MKMLLIIACLEQSKLRSNYKKEKKRKKEKENEMFQKVIAHIHNDVNIDDGHHRVLLLVEEYDGCNVAIETRVKEMMFFQAE